MLSKPAPLIWIHTTYRGQEKDKILSSLAPPAIDLNDR